MESSKMQFDTLGILKHQQNRFPLLFIDQITECIPGKKATGLKNYTYNEWFFPAHFEDEPNVPGFVQLESLAQTFIMTFLTIDGNAGKKAAALAIDNVRFKRKIVPGDQTIIHAELTSFRRGIASGRAQSFVDDAAACSAHFKVTLPDILEQFSPTSN